MKKPPTTEDLEALTCLQNELEEALLDRLGVFIKEHPEADSSQFAVNVFLSLAGRVGISHLGTEHSLPRRCSDMLGDIAVSPSRGGGKLAEESEY